MNTVTPSRLLKLSTYLLSMISISFLLSACGGDDNKSSSSSSSSSVHVFIPSPATLGITNIKASNADADDWFGWSVAISGDGNTLAVGAPTEDSKARDVNQDQTDNGSPNAGAVYIFSKNGLGNWEQQAYLKASNTEQPASSNSSKSASSEPAIVVPFNARFGYRVSLSTDGNTLAVSAIQENTPSFGTNCNQDNPLQTLGKDVNGNLVQGYPRYNIGAVYMFKRVNSQWAQNAYLKPTIYVGEPHLQFGNSLALSGDGLTLAVGTVADSLRLLYTTGTSESSSHSSASSSNNECRYFSSADSTASSSSSSSVASSNNSSIDLKVFGGQNSGAVYVYSATETSWVINRYLKAPDSLANTNFGISVALSFDGKTLAVGAEGEFLNSSAAPEYIIKDNRSYLKNPGATYVFQHENNEWALQQKLKASRDLINLQFGNSVAISGDGNTIAVGATGDVEPNGGIIHAIYPIPSEIPTQNNLMNNLIVDAYFLNPIDIDTSKLKIYSGAAFIFTKADTTWSEQAYIKASTPHANDNFGSSIALSSNGSVLAVGAFGESSQAKGINGDELDTSLLNSGAAYIFKLTGNSWTQKNYVKAPNTGKQDRFGRALGVDDSGEILMVGAYRESSNTRGITVDQHSSSSSSSSAPASGAVYLY